MTEWRTVFGHYEVSDAGTIRRGFRYLKPTPRNGYARVCLSAGRKRHYTTVHQLVAKAFLGPAPEGCEVAHLNGDRSDNRLENLSYKTKAENEADKLSHGTSQHGSKNALAKLTESDVLSIRKRLQAGDLQRVIAADLGVSRDLIGKVKRGVIWSHVLADAQPEPSS